MVSVKLDNEKQENAGRVKSKLTTESPLSEKDEQAKAIERTKKLQQKAQENWKNIKKKNS